MFRATFFLLLIAASGLLHAQSSVYKTTDKDGNIIFTDAPPANATTSEKLEIQRVNTTPAVKPEEVEEVVPAGVVSIKERPLQEIQEVMITAPVNGETIPMGPGNFTVSVKVKPSLVPGQTLQLFMDGVPYGDPQRKSAWDLLYVTRGKHALEVGIMDTKGEITVMSEPVSIHVLRPSIR